MFLKMAWQHEFSDLTEDPITMNCFKEASRIGETATKKITFHEVIHDHCGICSDSVYYWSQKWCAV